MAIRRIKGSWWIDLRLGGKRRRIKSPHQTKDAARDYEAILRTEYAKRGSLDRQFQREAEGKKQEPTFAEFSAQWMRDYSTPNNKPSTTYAKQRALARHLIPFFGSRLLSQIDAVSIEQFKARQIALGIKAKTTNNHLTCLRKCLSTAADWDLLAKLPRCRPLKTIPPPFRFLSDSEARRLIEAAPHGVWKSMVTIAVRTGLRISELMALRWEDVDFDRAMLRVAQACVRGVTGSPKNNMIRYIPLTREAIDALLALPRLSPLVFQRDGRPIRPYVASRALAAACRSAGIAPHGWHVLRHTFASELARRGASLQCIQGLLGHSSIDITLRYSHLTYESLLSAVRLLDEPDIQAIGHQMGTSPTRVADRQTSVAPELSLEVHKISDVIADSDGARGGNRTRSEAEITSSRQTWSESN